MIVRRLLVLACVMLAGTAAAQTPPFDPVGRWRFRHTDGSPFIGRLTADQAATSDFGTGERGIWRWEGNGLRMIYTSGWDDLLTREPDGRYLKRAWGPGADRCGPPTNTGPAERIATDPGAPL